MVSNITIIAFLNGTMILLYFIKPEYLHDQFLWIIYYFLGHSVLSVWLLNKGISSKNMIKYGLGATILRLLTAVLFFLFLSFIKIMNLRSMMIEFTSLYILFLIFELGFTLTKLRQFSKQNQQINL